MKLTKNTIALQKGLVIAPNDGMDNRIAVATVQAHLMEWGYMLDQDAFAELGKSDLSFIKTFNDESILYLKEILGGKHNYVPLYKNFPDEVMSKTDYELIFNLMLHYWTNGAWEPTEVEFERPIKFEDIKYNMISYGTSDMFSQIFTNLVSINQSLTPQDLAVVKWFVVNEGENLVFPKQIPFKENLCTLAGMGIEGLPVKTPTDVLRIAAHLSGGDISLPKVPYKQVRMNRWSSSRIENPARENFKFRKFSRKERRYLLSLLENTNCNVSEMTLKDQRWVRLGEILHPSEYKNKYPKAAGAFYKIRNTKVKSWYSKLNEAFAKDLESGLKVLSQRPGEFSRRIDWLVRTNPKQVNLIIGYLSEALKGTSNKVLFEVYTHFEKRMDPVTNRSIMVKGSRRRTQLPNLPALSSDLIEGIHSKLFETLKGKFSTLDSLGNCWIDEELKKIPLPTNMRNMNFSNKPAVRGQRIPFDNKETNTIRPYLHFTKNSSGMTIDLSVNLIGDGVRGKVVDWSRQKAGDFCVHSGDSWVRTGPCAEYVDINIDSALKAGYQYVLVQLNNYNSSPELCNENYFGIMERKYPKSNKLWLPETTTNAHIINDLKSKVNCAVIDLKNKEYIMIDEDAGSTTSLNVTSTNDIKQVEELVKLPKVSVYDLILLHVEARGRQVTLDQNVDTYFKFEDFSKSYEETGKWMGV